MKKGRTQFWEVYTFGKAFFRKSNYGRPEFGGTSLSREHFWGENDLWGRVILRKNIMRSALTLGGKQLFFLCGESTRHKYDKNCAVKFICGTFSNQP